MESRDGGRKAGSNEGRTEEGGKKQRKVKESEGRKRRRKESRMGQGKKEGRKG